MEKVIIKQIPIGPLQLLTYIVACPRTKEAIIIDPASEERKIHDIFKKEGFKAKYILNTHGHANHVLANQQLRDILSIPTCMHELDDDFFSKKDVRAQSSKELGLPPPDPVDLRLKDSDLLEVGTLKILVIHTPGHTPGSVCYLVAGNLFTGDTLFCKGGRTNGFYRCIFG